MSDTTSDTTSDIASDTSDFDLVADFEESMDHISALQASYETSLEKLHWIQDQIRQINPLDAILEELHAEALKEIEETGESSFGATLLARLSQKI
jgi:hypothetical protein